MKKLLQVRVNSQELTLSVYFDDADTRFLKRRSRAVAAAPVVDPGVSWKQLMAPMTLPSSSRTGPI